MRFSNAAAPAGADANAVLTLCKPIRLFWLAVRRFSPPVRRKPRTRG